ncbi:hypothetical protein [Corallibacter sp.]|uniref:hypothetical protein n=1 Tax=Corallibacter sp. TaxID=2038084 RepID=UPI003AB50D9F
MASLEKKKQTFKYDKTIGITLFLLSASLYLYFALIANLDLTEGKHVLFMDEQIVFDGVTQILNSENTSSFFANITHEGDHRYGKVLYNITSLFSAIPESIWGETGLIISARLVQVLLLISAYFIFSITFIKSWTLRSLLFLILLMLPSTSYYFSMPKPEPVQIFFISLFLYFAVKKNFMYGKHWLFLGVSLGAKISAFPIIAFYFVVSTYQELKNSKNKKLPYKTGAISLLSFIIGFVISEPMLLFGKIKKYINSTWKNTSHGIDDSSIGVIDWLNLIIDECSILHLFLLSFGIFCCFYTVFSLFKSKNSNRVINLKDKKHLIIFIGFALLLMYMLRVNRLWVFYLHIPFIFIMIGTMVYIEAFFSRLSNTPKRLRIVSLATIIPFIILTSLNINANSIEYTRLSERTKKTKHIKKSIEYNYIKNKLEVISQANNKTLTVYYDPHLYLLSSNNYYEINKFSGYFTYWKKQYDVIIYYKKHGEDLTKLNISETNKRYKSWKNAIDLYSEFTTKTNDVDSLYKLTNHDSKKNNFKQWTTIGQWTSKDNLLSKSVENEIDARVSDISLKKGKTYKLDFEIQSYTSGNLFYKFGGGSRKKIKNLNSEKISLNVTNNGDLDNFQLSGSFIGSIKNISLKEINNNKTGNNLLLANKKNNQKLLYVKLADPEMPKGIEIYVKPDIFQQYKNQE